MTIKLIAWDILCLALFWSVFCRSVRTDKTTKLDVRIAIYLVGLSSLLGFGAPLYGWEPDVVTLLIVTSIVIMQVTMAKHWGQGVPERFVERRFTTYQEPKEEP